MRRLWAARSRWLPGAVLAALYLLSALRVIGWAGIADPALLYWRDWNDQTLYLRSARAFGAFDLSAAQHWYPVLYPLLAAPFTALASQPFFVIDLGCYLIAWHGFRRVAAAFAVRRWFALALFAAATVGPFAFAKTWIEPWTTTPSAALLWLALGVIARVPRGITRADAVTLGLALGLLPFARPGDLPIGALIGLAALIALRRDRAALRDLLVAGGIATASLAAVYLAIYGAHASPYLTVSAQLGYQIGWIGWKAYVLLVDPRAWFGSGMGLLEYAPWLIPGAAGLIAAAMWSPADRRPLARLLLAVAVLYAGLMLSYVDLLPAGLWRYNNVHYFKWLMPLFALFGVRFAIDAWRRRVVWLAAVPVLAALLIRLEPVPVAAAAPARMVVFAAPRGAEERDVYFATAWLADARGEQRNTFDYKQILLAAEVRAVALRRPFAGDERWLGDAHVRAQLAGTDTRGFAPLYLTGPWPKTPVARYGLRVAFGPPCWVWPGQCPAARG